MGCDRRGFLKGGAVLAAAGAVRGGLDAAVGPAAEGEVLVAGEPVLEAPSPTSVGVAWKVNRLATGFVEIATKADFSDVRTVRSGELPLGVLDAESVTVRVTGLRPDTRYWYRTVTQEVVSDHNPGCSVIRPGARVVGKTHVFRTPGPRGASRFVVMNDTHAAWQSFAFTTAALKDGEYPLVIWNGDATNCTDAKEVAVRTFLDPRVPTKDYASETPILWTNGNHDYEGTWIRRLEEVMLARPPEERPSEFAALKWNFAVRQGDIALIGLDTGEGIHDDDTRLVGLGRHSAYRALQTRWLEWALARPEIASAPFAVAFCHIPLWNTGENPFGCWEPRPKGCSSWIRECYEQWGPVLDRAGVQLVVAGHEHYHRWDDEIPRFGWKQVVGGGPELSIPQWGEKGERYYPTLIEGVVRDNRLVVTTRDTWRSRTVSTRSFPPRKTALTCRTAVLWKRGDAGVAVYRIPALARAPNGDLIAVCDARTKCDGDLNVYHPIKIAIRRSSDGGATWTPTAFAWEGRWNDKEQWSGSDPSLIVDRQANKVFLLFNVWEWVRQKGVYQTFVVESSDNGATWSAPRNLTGTFACDGWKFGLAEKDGGSHVFVTSGTGIQLRDGTLVHTIVNGNGSRPGDVAVFGSEDHGRTWRFFGKPISGCGDESKIVELADGSWMVNSRNLRGARTVSVSRDRGETWSTVSDTRLPDPKCNGQLLKVGSSLLFSNCQSVTDRRNVVIRTSNDEGRTWDDGLVVCPGPSAYSDMAETADGDIAILYERGVYDEIAFAVYPRSRFPGL